MTRSLTVNFGMRYEYLPPFASKSQNVNFTSNGFVVNGRIFAGFPVLLSRIRPDIRTLSSTVTRRLGTALRLRLESSRCPRPRHPRWLRNLLHA